MTRTTNYIVFEFLSRSANEGFARGAVACFAAQLDPTLEELGDIKTAVSGSLLHSFRLAQQDHAQRFARQQTAGRRQNTCVGAFRKNDGLGFSPQLFFKLFKNGHKDNYLHIFGAESLCIALTASL